MIIGFGTFVTMTFSNVLLSDYVDLKSVLTVKATTLKKDFKGEIPKIYDSALTCFDTISYTYDIMAEWLRKKTATARLYRMNMTLRVIVFQQVSISRLRAAGIRAIIRIGKYQYNLRFG